MKDKFEIFTEIMYREVNTNHYHIYITIGQFGHILGQVEQIYLNWNDALTLKENVSKHFKRNIVPMGDCGANRLGGMFDKS